ncbi:MAG: toll/interleukin-1 receptor domain-containing protein [Phycisphaerales bacterium]|nr:MAG: toll/interleukin-1 receptor domain-containing protein [Phycisphaerales bacterium]
MDRYRALELLRGGKKGVAEWNRRMAEGEALPDLSGGDLQRARLREVNLHGADLHGANFDGADLSDADLGRVNLFNASLIGANVSAAHLGCADLRAANLSAANLSGAVVDSCAFRAASLGNANLSWARVRGADLRLSDLRGANFEEADLQEADFSEANLSGAAFAGASLDQTSFGNVDLAHTTGLAECTPLGPSTVGVDTLAQSKGRIPEAFLRGCGFLPWQVLEARMYDPALTAAEITDLQYRIFDLRTTGAIFLGGVFISYAHEDSDFVDKVYEQLQEKGAPVWLDRHAAVAGPIKRQVTEAIRVNDIVLLVLSKDSVKSDWVTHELKAARRREKKEDRDILCPVALDDSWKQKCEADPDWGHLTDKNILDFSAWETDAFEGQFEKLIRGFKRYYRTKGEDGDKDED